MRTMHWGWYWKIKKKHVARKLCSDFPSIDSFRLYQGNQINSFTVHPLDINAQTTSGSIKITYGKRKSHAHIISVEKNSCNYGGFRYFFKCPLCHKRMRFLYLVAQSIFLCRSCLNLGYNSQRLRTSTRLQEQSEKIKELIKNKGGDMYSKPLRMHQSTWNALRSKQTDYEIKADDALRKELTQWYGQKVAQFL